MWFTCMNSWNTQQSMAWDHTCSPNKQRKLRQMFSVLNAMATVFWDANFRVEVIERRVVFTSEVHFNTLWKLRKAIRNKCRGLLVSEVVFLVSRLHILNEHKNCWNSDEAFFIIPVPCVVSLYLSVHKYEELAWGQQFIDDEYLQNTLKAFLKYLPSSCYVGGVSKLVKCYDNCSDIRGEHVGKVNVSHVNEKCLISMHIFNKSPNGGYFNNWSSISYQFLLYGIRLANKGRITQKRRQKVNTTYFCNTKSLNR